jgi:hypothetical protein
VFVPTADGVAQNRRGLCDADHTSPVPQRQDGEAGPTLRNTRVYRRGLQALQQGTMGRRTRKPGSVGDAIVNSKSELKPLWDFLRAATKRNLQANLARQFDTQIGRNFAGISGGCRPADVRFYPVSVQSGPARTHCVRLAPFDSSFQTGGWNHAQQTRRLWMDCHQSHAAEQAAWRSSG